MLVNQIPAGLKHRFGIPEIPVQVSFWLGAEIYPLVFASKRSIEISASGVVIAPAFGP
jgi:hypothetical protein